MKKLGAFLVVGTLLLTGCGGKKVVCTSEVKDVTGSYKMNITANLKDNKVSKLSAEMKFEDDNAAEQMCSMLKAFSSLIEGNEKLDYKCNGKKITVNNYNLLVDSDDDSDKVIGITKDEFIKKMEESSTDEEKVTCK